MRVRSIPAVILFVFLSPLTTLPQETPHTWQVHFSPNGGCTETIVTKLNEAKSTVLVQAYSFKSSPIAEASLNLRLGIEKCLINKQIG